MAMKNGRDENYDDPKIASFSAARKKADEAKKKHTTGAIGVAGRSVGELLFGAVIVAMAVGLLVSLTRPLWQVAVSVSN